MQAYHGQFTTVISGLVTVREPGGRTSRPSQVRMKTHSVNGSESIFLDCRHIPGESYQCFPQCWGIFEPLGTTRGTAIGTDTSDYATSVPHNCTYYVLRVSSCGKQFIKMWESFAGTIPSRLFTKNSCGVQPVSFGELLSSLVKESGKVLVYCTSQGQGHWGVHLSSVTLKFSRH